METVVLLYLIVVDTGRASGCDGRRRWRIDCAEVIAISRQNGASCGRRGVSFRLLFFIKNTV